MPSRQEVVTHLQEELATAFVMSFNARRYHWMVSGPIFYSLHKLFNKLYEAIDGTTDELAERIRQLGGCPVTTPSQFESFSVVAPSVPTPAPDPMALVAEALAAQRAVMALMQKGVVLSQAAGEWGVADLLTRDYQTHQKFEWFLREILA